jgi:hypothetical protein
LHLNHRKGDNSVKSSKNGGAKNAKRGAGNIKRPFSRVPDPRINRTIKHKLIDWEMCGKLS